MTERSRRARFVPLAAAGVICVLVGAVCGCGKTTGGNAVRAGTTAASTTTSGAPRKSDPAEPVPGVEATPPDHIPPNALACLPAATGNGRMTAATVSDPVAPRLTVPLPDGWNSAPGSGDVALTATGTDGLSARVTITPTDLEPGGAFLRYGADLRTANPGVQVSVEPAQFCGYSSQLLGGSTGGVAFADRITHIWTNTKAFLVVVHLEGPAGAPGFNAAKSTVMQQFAVVIP
ncbi:hypothetical protein [Mycobacterium sp. pR1184]|uniref:hypothetical protein n=1 Tax=Mycobacterium sp. pR1184 TaxID=3238981 RepID=UPI00351B7E9A